MTDDTALARFERRADFVACMVAPVIGYSAAQTFERWAVRNPFFAHAPLYRIPLGLANLALGGWLGFLALRFVGRGLSRWLARCRRI